MTTTFPEPNKEFLDGETPVIEWADKKWPIPTLAPRQNRFIIPALLRSRDVLKTFGNADAVPLTEAQYDDFTSVMFWGLKRAHPGLTRDQFDDIPLPVELLMRSITIIAGQTGVVRKGMIGDGSAAPLGEAKPNHQIGTQ